MDLPTKISSKIPHECMFCGKQFNGYLALQNHTGLHTGEKPHSCDVCGKQFTFSRNLEAHLLSHTITKIHKCDICGKLLARASNLKTHQLVHTGEKRHKCDICGKQFTIPSSLNTHLLLHTGEKPHKCEICGKEFARAGNLSTHVLTHTGEKQHQCNICHKLFARSGNLKTHMLVHGGEKPYKCEICGKQYTLSANLKIHYLTHTGEKPEKCDICDKEFRRVGNMKRHMLTHTSKRRYKCGVCGVHFARTGDLERHNSNKHTGKPDEHDIGEEQSVHEPEDLENHDIEVNGENTNEYDVCEKQYIHSSDNNSDDPECSLEETLEIEHAEEQFILFEKSESSVVKHKEEVNDTLIQQFIQPGNSNSNNIQHPGEKPTESGVDDKQVIQSADEDTENHALKHTDEMPSASSESAEEVAFPKNRKTQNDKNTDVTPHRCDLCGTHFTSPVPLKIHRLLHAEEKQVKDGNNKQHTQFAEMDEEEDNAEKPFECGVCGLHFTFSSTLMIHMRMHT